MTSLTEHLQTFVARHPAVRHWWVAYSGGLDSTLLLHALVKVQTPQPVAALHIHHGLSAAADDWQSHCQQQCEQLGVEFRAVRVRVDTDGRGWEEAARRARYEVFEQTLGPDEGLLLAHHADDQAETLLLRLLRGSGLRGLSAMADSRPLGYGTLYRPLLHFSRAQLEQQARSWELSWVEDESNQSPQFDRNYLRHQVLPPLRQRWPGFTARWQQSADWCRQADALMGEVAAADWAALEWRSERLGSSVSLPPLLALSEFRWGNLLRYWLEREGCSLPALAQLQQLRHQLLSARGDRQPQIGWPGVCLRSYQQRLYLLPEPAVSATPPADCHWDGCAPLQWGDWQLSREPVAEGGMHWPQEGVTVTSRLGGERCQPHWRAHSQTLKKLLQEVQLEPWLRDSLPLLWHGDQLLAVADLWHCRGWSASGEPGYRLRWEPVKWVGLVENGGGR